jgi:translation initiation factor 1
MSDVCPRCGLPKDLCICETLSKEEQQIKIRKDKKRYGKIVTIIEGIDSKDINLRELAKNLKNKFACGGTYKEGMIELQGDHLEKVKKELIRLGFNPSIISL